MNTECTNLIMLSNVASQHEYVGRKKIMLGENVYYFDELNFKDFYDSNGNYLAHPPRLVKKYVDRLMQVRKQLKIHPFGTFKI
jgi:hypothetical protein